MWGHQPSTASLWTEQMFAGTGSMLKVRTMGVEAINSLPAALKGEGLQILAREVRAARKQRRWTLAELSAATALDKGYLSKVERGLKSPSLASVLNLARALDVPVGRLFGEAIDDSSIHVSRAGTRVRTEDDNLPGYSLEVLASNKDRSGLQGFLLFPPAEFTDEFRAEHDGEELLFTVDGQVEVKFADRVVSLDRGDAIQFPGRLQHQVRRTSASACVLVTVSRT